MQFLAQFASKLLICVGVVITVVSCVVSSAMDASVGTGPLIGIGFVVLGGVLWRKASKKQTSGDGKA